MSILLNPVLISVVVMLVLCLLKLNVLVALIVSAVVAGITAGMTIPDTMDALIGGMGGASQTALSYVLLGALAFGIQSSGLAAKLANGLQKLFGKKGIIFALLLAFISCFSQNLILVHISFIPILIPPLLKMMNGMKLDRRAAACSLTFGLKAPYMLIPAGYGIIFHGIVANAMTTNGMPVEASDVWRNAALPVLGMLVGLLIAVFFSYRKPREYQDLPLTAGAVVEEAAEKGFTLSHWGALIGSVAAFVIQLTVGSLPLGAIVGLAIMLATGAIKYKKLDDTINGGVIMMGLIAFVMLVASGYGDVIRATGGVNALVEASVNVFGGSKLLAAFMMLFFGLVITMGIGTSFGTIPIVAAVYVPLCLGFGFSVPATICLILAAGALGDAGSPASDSTLGPTAGLNADGQHNHIWDTCVPTFLHFNVPILIFGTIAALIL